MQVFTSPMPKYKTSPGQIVLFPSATTLVEEEAGSISQTRGEAPATEALNLHLPVVLSGSYRKDFEGLRRTYEELQDLGCRVLSPSSVTAVNEIDGFVYMKGEEVQNPEDIETRHLNAIQSSNFVWLHCPNGYLGPTAAAEVGFANAVGVPVYAREAPSSPGCKSGCVSKRV